MAGVFNAMMLGNGIDNDFIHVEFDHNSVHFAVATIYQWWLQMGKNAYLYAKNLLIITDIITGRDTLDTLWRKMFKELADNTKLDITVCHFPQGTHKWNNIDHNMSSHIVKNWPDKPLIRHEVSVNLITDMTNRMPDKTMAKISGSVHNDYSKFSDKTDQSYNMAHNPGKKISSNEWNYTICYSLK